MAKVYILKQPALAPALPLTWALYRLGDGPFRCEGQGFKSVKEARAFAKAFKHEIVTLTAKGVR